MNPIDWMLDVEKGANGIALVAVMTGADWGPVTVRIPLDDAGARLLADALMQATGDARLRVLAQDTPLTIEGEA